LRSLLALWCFLLIGSMAIHAAELIDHASGVDKVDVESVDVGNVDAGDVEVASDRSRWVSAIANDRFAELATSNGKSALMVASKMGELSLAKQLVELGANVNERTATGGTPFMFAVLGDHIGVAQWLHSRAAAIDASGSNGWTAMTIAAAKGQSEMLRWLLSIGADLNAIDVYQFTPLMRAVDNRHLESVMALISSGKADLDARDESGNSSLHHAVANDDLAMVKLLMGAGALADLANRDGLTPADIARLSPVSEQLLKLVDDD